MPCFKAKFQWIRPKGLLLAKYLCVNSVTKILKHKNSKTSKSVSLVDGANQYSCPRVNKLNLMRKHQTNSNWETFYKITILYYIESVSHKTQRKYSRLKEMTTKCDTWTWIGSRARTYTCSEHQADEIWIKAVV